MSFSEEELRAQAKMLQQQLLSEDETDYSQDYDYDEDNAEENEEEEQEERYPEFKKYVFKVDTKYIEMIEQLSYDDRHLFINELLEDYIQKDIEQELVETNKNIIKRIIFSIIFVLVGIPLLFWFFNVSLDATHSNYRDMQNKFIELYNLRNKY